VALNPLASRRLWLSFGSAMRFALVMGVVFGLSAGAVALKPPLVGAVFGLLSACMDFALMMAAIGAFEIFGLRTAAGRRFLALPFLVTVLVKAVLYLAVLVAVIGGRIGPSFALLFFSPGIAKQLVAQAEPTFLRGFLIVVAAIVVFLLVALRNAAQLVGERTFREIVFGRYHRPRAEERFFLFIDIVGSTPIAERIGPLAVHRYLDRVFQIASDPIDEQRGDVYQYVGDEIVVTWRLEEGRPQARPLACFFAIEDALARAAPAFEREFGEAPKLRAALHAGEVVTGEIGLTRRAIVFHGDVMNTTSRIENKARELDKHFLVSEDALRRLEGAERYSIEDLGPQPLRGREAATRVYAVGPMPRP
jgi:adenylate cyclase